MTENAELLLQIDAPDMDDNELDELARLLRDEIEELDVESVEQVSRGEAPEGMMSVDWVQVGDMAIKLAPIVVPPLIAVLRAWVDRQYKGTTDTRLKLKIKWGDFCFDLKRDTSRQEAANIDKKVTEKAKGKKKK